jgi:hypothetical protein
MQHGFHILTEAKELGALKDSLMAHLQQPIAKLQKNKEVDEASMQEAARIIGDSNAPKKSMKQLQDLYKKVIKAAKLKPEKSATQIYRAWKGTKRSMLIFKYEFIVFELVHAVTDRYGNPMWLVCQVMWLKEPGEDHYYNAGARPVLYQR